MMEYEHEPVRGLPARLPEGERMLWQGSPELWPFMRSVFHVRAVVVYFLAIMAWSGIAAWSDGGLAAGIRAAAWIAPIALAALAIFAGLAWAMARATVYTVTDKRLVMRFGVALPMAVNIPFTKVDTVSVCEEADGTGNISFVLGSNPGLGYAMLWPHVRPLRIVRPQPMLRGIAEVGRIAALLREPLAGTTAAAGAQDKADGEAARVSSFVRSGRQSAAKPSLDAPSLPAAQSM